MWRPEQKHSIHGPRSNKTLILPWSFVAREEDRLPASRKNGAVEVFFSWRIVSKVVRKEIAVSSARRTDGPLAVVDYPVKLTNRGNLFAGAGNASQER